MAILFPRPEQEFVHIDKKEVQGVSCSSCHSVNVKEYPVLRAKGWANVVKCQDCLTVMNEEELPIWGFWKPLTADWNRKKRR